MIITQHAAWGKQCRQSCRSLYNLTLSRRKDKRHDCLKTVKCMLSTVPCGRQPIWRLLLDGRYAFVVVLRTHVEGLTIQHTRSASSASNSVGMLAECADKSRPQLGACGELHTPHKRVEGQGIQEEALKKPWLTKPSSMQVAGLTWRAGQVGMRTRRCVDVSLGSEVKTHRRCEHAPARVSRNPQNSPCLQVQVLTWPARSRSPRSACASAIAPSTSTGDSSAMLADSARQRSSAASDARRSPRCGAGSLQGWSQLLKMDCPQ